MMKKQRMLLIGIILIVIVIAIALYLKAQFYSPLYRSSHVNFAWGSVSFGYTIYSNGIIEEYDDYNKDKKLKKGKISSEELEKLKNLADLVNDEYKRNNSFQMFDAGVTTKEIYSPRLKKWVVLSKWGDKMGNNSSKESQEILELTEDLYNI